MNVVLLALKLSQVLRNDGIRGTVVKAYRNLFPNTALDDFDRIHGTDTGGKQNLYRFTIRSANAKYGVYYAPTDENQFLGAMAALNIDASQFTFIDLGCGKGRTLIQAAELGFQDVIGVEFASELVDIALGNITKLGLKNVRIVHDDAALFELPASDFVLYMNNPFSEEVMQAVIDKLPAAGKFYVVYRTALCADVLNRSRRLKYLGTVVRFNHIHLWQSA